MIFSALKTILYRGLDENASDSTVIARVEDWINEIVSEICLKKGIKGLAVEGYADFAEDDLFKPLTISSAHNSNSRLVKIEKCWTMEYTYSGAAWVASGTDKVLQEIAYAEYLDMMVDSRDVSTPEYYAILDTDVTESVIGAPNCYLYPPPDSDDTEGDDGLRYRLHYYGEADIGDLSASDDIVYPIGAEHIIKIGVAWKQAEYDRDIQAAQWHFSHFDRALKDFIISEHAHKSMYVFGRALKQRLSTPRAREPIEAP